MEVEDHRLRYRVEERRTPERLPRFVREDRLFAAPPLGLTALKAGLSKELCRHERKRSLCPPRSCCADGNAMMTIVASSTTISCATPGRRAPPSDWVRRQASRQ
jgi:hypothetical protein